jgi:hypothetical protein
MRSKRPTHGVGSFVAIFGPSMNDRAPPTSSTTRPVNQTRPQNAAIYRAGALAAASVVGLFVIHTIIFLTWRPPAFEPTRENTRAWFALFDASPVVALVDLDALMLLDFVLVVILFVALWKAVRSLYPNAALVALLLVAISSAVYLASNPAFTMLSLANGYRVADVESRDAFVAAGQSALAVYHGTPFDVAYVLSAIGGIVMTVAMRRSRVFGAVTGYVGVVMYAMNLVPPTAGVFGLVLSIASLPLLVVWLLLVARRLSQLTRS